MLQELTHMDRITQLQDAIESLLTIMSRSIDYLHTRTDFKQVSDHIPITKARNPDKVHKQDVFDANRAELVTDLVRKAKQIEFLIDALPAPEPDATQAARLAQIEADLQTANEEYTAAVTRARSLTHQITTLLRTLLATDPLPSTSSDPLTLPPRVTEGEDDDDDAMDQDLEEAGAPTTPPPRTPPAGMHTPPNRTGRGVEAGWKPPTPRVQTPEGSVSDGAPESPWVKGTEPEET